jgi:hypothetical protein
VRGALVALLLALGPAALSAAAPDEPDVCAGLAVARRELARARRGSDPDQTVDAYLALRRALEDAGQPAKSRETAQTALRLEQGRAVPRPGKQADILYWLGTRLTQDHPGQAIPLLTRASVLAKAEPCREALMRSGLGVAEVVMNDAKPSRGTRAAAVMAFDRSVLLLRGIEKEHASVCEVRLNVFTNAAKAYDAFAPRKAVAAWADVFAVIDQEHLALESPDVAFLLPAYVKHLRAVRSPDTARFAELAIRSQAAAPKSATKKKPSCE